MPPQKRNSTNQKTSTRASGGNSRTPSSPKRVSDDVARHDYVRRAGIVGFVTIALSIVLFIALFMDAGNLGRFINNFLRGLFSNATITLPIALAWIGISSFLAPTMRTSRKYWLSFAAVTFIAVVIHIFSEYPPTNIATLFERGQRGLHGGVVGGLIGNFLIWLIGVAGAIVVAITGIIVTFVLITGISIQIILSKFGARIKGWRAQARENRYIDEQLRQERLEQLALEREQKPPAPESAASSTATAATATAAATVPAKPERYGPINAKESYFSKYFRRKPQNESQAQAEPAEFIEPTESAEPIESTNNSAEPPATAGRNFKLSIENIEELVDNIEVEPTSANSSDIVTTRRIPAVTDVSNTTEFKPSSLAQPQESEEFEPPSLTQKREELESSVQAAIDKGVPIDEAFTRAKNDTVGEIEQLTAVPTFENVEIPNYEPPPLSLLSKPPAPKQTAAQLTRELDLKANKLLETLASFGVEATIENVVQGPTVTRFEVTPGAGVKVSKITNLSDDIALALAATGVIIAPIAGKSAIGVEIPNEIPETVSVKEVIDTDDFGNFRSKTAFALGKDIAGNLVIADIAKMPHLLVAGSTGSGKSVCINSLITSILYKAKPNEVKMIMIDPKMVELTIYNGIPHLFIPVVTDSKKAASALNWAVLEMENRYKLFEANRCRNLQTYNELVERDSGGESAKLPEIIIIIDELADLMMVAKAEVEGSIARLAAKARAAGMYLVIATQRPSVDVITGVIKANVPSRIAFAVASHIDSRTIIDTQGAEKLLGRGDMLYYPQGASKPMRIQGNFVSDADVEKVVEFVKSQSVMEYDEEIMNQIENLNESQLVETEEDNPGNADELLPKAIEMAIELSQASVAMLQRRFKIGYQRAARIIDQMEERGIIGPYEGTKPRQVLISKEEFLEMSAANDW